MEINKTDTAVVFIDPQNKVLSEKGLAWLFVGESVTENKTVQKVERIFKAAKKNGSRYSSRDTIFFPRDGEAEKAGMKMRPTKLLMFGKVRYTADARSTQPRHRPGA